MADYTVRFLGDDKQLSGTLKNIKGELNSTGQASSKLDQIQQRFNRIINSSAPLKKQLRDLTALMAKMNLDNMVDNDVFVTMTAKAAEMKDALGDASQAIRLMSSDTAKLDATIEGFQVLAGAAGVVTGVMGTLGTENERLQQAMLKVQSVISVMNGVQQIANALNKDSILMLRLKALQQKINNALTATSTSETEKNTASTTVNTAASVVNTTSTKKDTIAQKAWNVVKAISKALLGDFTGLLIVGAGALLTYALATGDSTDEEKKSIETKNQLSNAINTMKGEVTSSVASMMGKYYALQKAWESCRTEHQKIEFINKNKDAWKDLGVSLDTVQKTEDFYVKNTNKVTKAIERRAAKMALMAQLQKSYEQYYEEMVALDTVQGGGYYHPPKKKKAGDTISEAEAKKYGIKGSTINNDPIYGTGGGNIVLDEAGAALYNLKKDREANSKALQKREANRKKAVNKFNKKAQFINSQLEALGDDNDLGDDYPDTPTSLPKPTRSRTNKGNGGNNNNDTDTRTEFQKYIDNLNDAIAEAEDKLNTAIIKNEDASIIKPLREKLKELKEAKADIDGAIKAGVSVDAYKTSKLINKDLWDLGKLTIGGNFKLDLDTEAVKRKGKELADAMATPIPTDQLYKFTEEYQSAVEQLKGTEWGESLFNMLEGDTTADKVSGIGQSFQALGNVLANFDGAAAKAGAVLAAVGQIVLGFAEASTMAAKLGPIGWLAWLGAGLAAVATTIATIKGFADGGIIEGSSYHGDRIVARLNAGEMVLNRKQQANLFRALDNGIASNVGGGKVEFEIKGSTLKGVLKNYDNKMNKVR